MHDLIWARNEEEKNDIVFFLTLMKEEILVLTTFICQSLLQYFVGKVHCQAPNVQSQRTNLDKLIGFDGINEASFRQLGTNSAAFKFSINFKQKIKFTINAIELIKCFSQTEYWSKWKK